MRTMSEDAKAIVLLCGRIGSDGAEPLQQLEYARVVHWLMEAGLRPADLHDPKTVARVAAGADLPHGRLAALLGRGVQLGFSVDRWNQSGLWVICRSDPEYPLRVKSHLRDRAPPILFGAGDPALLSASGLAVVGSRKVDATGQEFARDVAAWCAQRGVPVVSGGARSGDARCVDQIAMSSALENGGVVLGVLADGLLRRSVGRDARDALADGRLLLISPYHPEARFTVEAAKGCNKLVYAMAEFALVVSAESGRGGTWQGATEELERSPHRPVFVRMSASLPKGNEKLLARGAKPFPDWTPNDDPQALLAARAATPQPRQASLFDLADECSGASTDEVREPTPRGVPDAPRAAVGESVPDAPTEAPTEAATEAATEPAATVFDAVLPLIVAALEDAIPADELARRLEVAPGQLNAWLSRAVEDKHVRKLSKPVRYIRRG